MPAYHPAYRAGENIHIRDRDFLVNFQQNWKFHHPLQEEQLAYADKECFVRRVSYYHCGDCLYELGTWEPNTPDSRFVHEESMPGVWHESCLKDQDLREWNIPLPVASEVYKIVPTIRDNQRVVVVRTIDGLECLVMRHNANEAEAALMSEVATMRNTLSFEWRYNFHGVAHDAVRQQALERAKQNLGRSPV